MSRGSAAWIFANEVVRILESQGEYRQDCSPNSGPGLLLVIHSFNLFIHSTFIKPTVLSQDLCQNLRVQHVTSQTYFLPLMGAEWGAVDVCQRGL